MQSVTLMNLTEEEINLVLDLGLHVDDLDLNQGLEALSNEIDDYNGLPRVDMPSKYKNTKTEIDGIVFDSKAEAKRYRELKILEQAGEISFLQRQVEYVLTPKMKDEAGKAVRETKYKADFVYHDLASNKTVVEDVKGFRTPDYVIKSKLMLERHGVTVREVKAR